MDLQFIDINRCGGYSRLFVVCIRCGNAVRLDTGFRFFVNIRCRKGTSDQYIVSINVNTVPVFRWQRRVLSISIEPLRFGRPMSDQLALLSELSRIGRPVVFCRYDWDLNIYPYEMYCLCLDIDPSDNKVYHKYWLRSVFTQEDEPPLNVPTILFVLIEQWRT